MSAAEASKEKGLIIKGIVKGEPIYAVVSPGDYVRHRLMFPIELTEDITVNFKKAKGVILKSKSLIIVKCSKAAYVSIGDKIQLSGKIIRVKSEKWGITYMYINANELFNETQQTGILMY